jgi:hypothetical protein
MYTIFTLDKCPENLFALGQNIKNKTEISVQF